MSRRGGSGSAGAGGVTAGGEEGLDLVAAGVGEDPGDDVDPVIERRMVEGLHGRVDGAGLGLGGAVDEPGDAGVDERAGAHETGFDGNVERDPGEPVVAARARGGPERDDFGVGGGVGGADGVIEAAAEDPSVGVDDDRADGDLVAGRGAGGLGERLTHVWLVLGRLHRAPSIVVGRMKGLILSGGKGTRLRPLTFTSAKQLVPVANKPILFYGIETLAAAGIREIGMVVGETHEEIRAAVGDGSRWGVSVTYIPQDAPRGLAHAVLISEPFLGTEPFVMYLGDNLLAQGIVSLVREFEATTPAAQILLTPVAHPEQYGVAETVGDTVVRLEEKPTAPRSNLALVGVYMFGPEVFTSVRRIRPSFRNELEITDAIQDLIDRDLVVRPHIVNGWWKDTGRLEDMLEANRLLLDQIETRVEGSVDAASRIEGKVVIEAGAVVTGSVVRGPVIIGHEARIHDAYVGPFTAIMREVEVRGSEIEHSIVMEGSRITGLTDRVTDSLIGRNVTIGRRPSKPAALRFMLGDRSEVGLC